MGRRLRTTTVRRSPSPGGRNRRPRLRASGRWTQCPALPGARVWRLAVRRTSQATCMRAWSRLWRRPWPQACRLVKSGAASRCCVPPRPVARRWSVCSSAMPTTTPRGWMLRSPRRTSRGCLPKRGRAAWGSCRGCRQCRPWPPPCSPVLCRRRRRRLLRRWATLRRARRTKTTMAGERSRPSRRRGPLRRRRGPLGRRCARRRPSARLCRRGLPPLRASRARVDAGWARRGATRGRARCPWPAPSAARRCCSRRPALLRRPSLPRRP
jgi:hypothetical protein